MDNLTENSKNKEEKLIDVHIKIVNLFKKVIESAIEFENEKGKETYGYRLVNSEEEEDDIYLNIYTPTFYSLMINKKIILKTKLKMSKIYFVLFILARIIDFDMLKFDESFLVIGFFYNISIGDFVVNGTQISLTEMDILIEKMLEEPGDYWIKNSGHEYPSVKENIENDDGELLFNFTQSTIYQYLYEETENTDRRYVAKIGSRFDTIYCDSRLSKEKQFFQNVKNSTKFSFNKNNLIEYTLEDILDYLNYQLENYELFKQMNQVQNEAIMEAKNPKMIQKCLDAGQTIDEALESVGFNST